MADLLESLNANADPEKIPSMSRKVHISRLREQLKTEKRAKEIALLHAHIAWQLLLDGKNEESVLEFQRATKGLSDAKIPPDDSFFRRFYELCGLANLRLAEQKNCIEHHNCQPCIIPIMGTGVHQIPTPARAARDQFKRLLALDSNDLRSRWLLNISYMTLGEYPDQVPKHQLIPPAVFQSQFDIGRFFDVATTAGVATLGLSGGVVVEDFDGDGLLDVMASDWGTASAIEAVEITWPNRNHPVQTFTNVPVDHTYQVHEGKDSLLQEPDESA